MELPPLFYDIAGLMGVGFYILAYALLQFGLLTGSNYSYVIMNMLGATLVLVSTFKDWNAYSAMISVLWITISLYGLYRIYFISRAVPFTYKESRFLRHRLEELPAYLARKLFDQGDWRHVEPGERLSQAGEPIGGLYFLADGHAAVEKSNQEIATLNGPCFVGEMSCFNRQPASATVTIKAPSEIFHIGWEQLDKFCRAHPEVKMLLKHSFNAEMKDRLVATNTLLLESFKQRDPYGAAAVS